MSQSSLSPVRGIYILDETGIPLFARTYDNTDIGDETVLLSGFLAAIELFARAHLEGEISDIGMTTRRYFFLKKESLIYVVSINITPEQKYYTDPDILETAINLLENISLAFEIIYESSGGKNKEFEELVETFGPTADSILMEATIDLRNFESEGIPSQYELAEKFKGETINLKEEADEVEHLLEELKKAAEAKDEKK